MSRYWAALKYFIEEAAYGLWRSKGVNLLAVAIISSALFVLGAFLLAATNIQKAVAGWGESLEVTIFLTEEAADEAVAALKQQIDHCPLVEGVVYISKEEAAQRFRDYFPGLRGVAANIEGNPLPASLEVRLGRDIGPEQMGQLEKYAEHWAANPEVDELQLDTRWLERVSAMAAVVRLIGALFGAIISLAAALTTAAVIRLALMGRRDEIEIMRIVGATPAFVKGPHLFEGMVLGLLGALSSLVLLHLVWSWFLHYLERTSAVLLGFLAVDFLSRSLTVSLILSGLFLGLAGSALALTRFPISEE
jgi:cell division transport system permease protein